MKRAYKILLFFASHIALMLIAPLVAVKLVPADGGMAICMIMFFIAYPIYSIFLGVIISRDMKHLWWMPLVNSVCFPLLFSLAMLGMVWELYAYSAIYLFLGYAVAALLSVIKKIRFERQNNDKGN